MQGYHDGVARGVVAFGGLSVEGVERRVWDAMFGSWCDVSGSGFGAITMALSAVTGFRVE